MNRFIKLIKSGRYNLLLLIFHSCRICWTRIRTRVYSNSDHVYSRCNSVSSIYCNDKKISTHSHPQSICNRKDQFFFCVRVDWLNTNTHMITLILGNIYIHDHIFQSIFYLAFQGIRFCRGNYFQ